MVYHISGECISCGDCAVACPQGAIDDGYAPKRAGNLTPTGRIDNAFHITPGCNDCSRCLSVCPVGAIFPLEGC